MPLKTRLTILVLAAATALCALLAALLWWRDQELTARHHDALLQAQRIGWNKLNGEAVDGMQDALVAVLAQPAWALAWKSQDRQALGRLLRDALVDQPQWRADLLDARGRLVYSTSAEFQQDSLIEAGWVTRVLPNPRPESGLSQVSRDRYYLIAAQSFGNDPAKGVLAFGMEVNRLLPELAGTLAGEVFLLNLRGREVAGTRPGLVDRERLALPVRLEGVSRLTLQDGAENLAIVQPLAGPDQRRIGALLLLRDVTQQWAADRRALVAVAAGASLFMLVLGALLLSYLRRALRPLERSVKVLGALSRGDLRTALDEQDQALPDEAGHIARGVEALRFEMLSLQMLRDERIRTRQQQERLIRNQLKRLAESLDESSRAEILAALEPEGGAPGDAPAGNDIAELARILGRMSGLVTTQQERLVGLLKELRNAMEQQAMLLSLQQELEIARNIQLSILPRKTPDTPAVDVAELMIPAKEIGGDFYDYFLVDDEHLAVVIADVSGKGIAAAFFMAIARTLLKSNALFLREPSKVMARLNDQLCAENEQMMFVTVFLGVVHLPSGQVDYVNAGHNPPLVRHGDGQVSVLPSGKNTAVGVMEDLSYVQGAVTLRPGDTFLLYTDGVTEATNPQGLLFGEKRLLETVRREGSGSKPLPQAILDAVRTFEDGAPQADDITCVAVRYAGTAEPPAGDAREFHHVVETS